MPSASTNNGRFLIAMMAIILPVHMYVLKNTIIVTCTPASVLRMLLLFLVTIATKMLIVLVQQVQLRVKLLVVRQHGSPLIVQDTKH